METLRAEVAGLEEEVCKAEAAKMKVEREAAGALKIFHEVDEAFFGCRGAPGWTAPRRGRGGRELRLGDGGGGTCM